MKIKTEQNNFETNSESESKEFGIGDASVVIEILRNRLYENKVRTLVQEYISNARDAHREIGKDPSTIEITLPTRLSPTFKVRDFGPGITPDRMDNVFRLYGASTKRGTNNQTGGFGIGAKSAWSYTDSFTVVTYVDGTRRAYVCHTGSNSQGSLDLVSTEKTDEKNGTEIRIAVRAGDINEFVDAALRAIYFWEVLPAVKGLDSPLSVRRQGLKVSENIEVIDRNSLPSFIGAAWHLDALAVIDGIPYLITEKLLSKASKLKKFIEENNKKFVILHFGNGIVEVSASRESIADSNSSIEALNRMGAKGALVVSAYISETFSKVNSTAEWITAYKELSFYFNADRHSKFGEYSIVMDNIVSERLLTITMTSVHCLCVRKRYQVERITRNSLFKVQDKTINIEMLGRIFLITKEESQVVRNKRLRAYFKNKPIKLSEVILMEYSGDPANVDQVAKDLGVKPFESLEYTDPPKEAKVKVKREDEEFCMEFYTGTRFRHTSLSKNEKRFLYIDQNDTSSWKTLSNLRDLACHIKKIYDLEIVGLSKRALKMIQGDPSFTPLRDWLDSYRPSDAHVNYAIAVKAANLNEMETIFDLEGIKDEFLNEMIKEYKPLIEGKRKIFELPELLLGKANQEVKALEFFEKDKKLKKLFETEYPLVCQLGKYSTVKKELVFYINGKYNN